MTPVIATLAILLEALFGYPAAVQRRIGHPVEWMGAFIAFADTRWNSDHTPPASRRRAGIVMIGVLCAVTALIAVAIVLLLRTIPYGWLGEAVIASVFLAQRQLAESVRAVAEGLDVSLRRGRQAVSHIVGRDTTGLDEPEISRAAIETLAENASDGVIAPLFWLLLLGLPGIAVYKAINTADSMVGHLNQRHGDFGFASARLDDWVNWVPARITAGLFCLAALVVPGANALAACRTALRDARGHESPNAGWPEAAMAGAFGFGLGGPRSYQGTTLRLPMMGKGRRHLGPADIRQALRLYGAAGIATFAVVAGLSVLVLI